jgi:tight adherence protein C
MSTDIAAQIMDPDNMIMAGAGVVTFFTVVTLASPMMGRSNLEGRLRAVANRREELRRRSREALAQKGANPALAGLRRTDTGLYKTIVDRFQLSRLLEDSNVADKLAQAGFRGPRPITTFYFFRFVTPFAFAALTAVYLFAINGFGLPVMSRLCACIAGLTFGFYAPNVYISNKAAHRRESIVAGFPDSLDLLLICVESGMSIEAALAKVGQEIGSASIELAEELSLLVAELSYLPDRRLAYEGLARRTNHPGVKSVATAMIQAERYGTPLGAALRVMAKENRELRLSAAEKKAAALPAKLTVPMILFFLPVLFDVIIGPAALRVHDILTHKHG